MEVFTFRATVDIRANNLEMAKKHFLNFVGKKDNAGMQNIIQNLTLERHGYSGYILLDGNDEEKDELIAKISSIKPHTGKTPLEEFSVTQLEHHLKKLEQKELEEKEKSPPKKQFRKKKFKKI